MAGSTAEATALARRLSERGEDAARYAPWFDRGRCREALAGNGLPRFHAEAWRHTNPRPWYAAALGANGGGADVRVQAPPGVDVATFDEPRAADLFAQHSGDILDPAEHPLAAVNGLLLGAGVVVHAPAGLQAAIPVRIDGLGAAFQHVLVVAQPGAALTVLETPSAFAHRVVECVVAAGARLTHLRRQDASGGCECSLVAATVAEGGRYELAQLSKGAALRRNDLLARIDGPNARAHIRAAWRLDDGHLDNQVRISHAEGGGTSRQTYRGVAGGRSRAVLNGAIHIAPGADGSDASLTAKNLLTSATAQVFAKPALEINASDVKCAHGATVGALDEEAVLYLRSRGIGESDARDLLVRAFLAEAIVDEEGARSLGLSG